ncbi:MAG: hypothetical protein KOO69_01875 [Victivallales bacterium]|nr:hypothetical protein [Victivallales bacterium]
MFKLFPLILLIIITGCTSFPIPSGSKHILSGKSKPYEKIVSRKRSGYKLKCDYRNSTRKLQITLCEKSRVEIDRISEKTFINEYYYTLIGFYPHYTSAFWGKPSTLNMKNTYGIKMWAGQTTWLILYLFVPWLQTQSQEFDREWKPYYESCVLTSWQDNWLYAVVLGWAKTSRTIRTVSKNKERLTRVQHVPIGKDFTIEIVNQRTKQRKIFHAKNGDIYISRKMLPGRVNDYPRIFKINCKKYNCSFKYTITKKIN